MLVLGIGGFVDSLDAPVIPDPPPWLFHDSAAGLVLDGRVVAAIEDERLSRAKHGTWFPERAISACLDIAGRKLSDVDAIAFNYSEAYCDGSLYYLGQDLGLDLGVSARALLTELIRDAFGPFDESILRFIGHHESHARHAITQSGLEDGLTVVMDGSGEDESVSVYRVVQGLPELVHTYPTAKSLGHFYTAATETLGFSFFDEYKVMGLAPYGNADRYTELFDNMITLRDDGDYDLDYSPLKTLAYEAGLPLRQKGGSLRQEHKDFAAAAQAALERIAVHIIDHWRDTTGADSLLLTGGVAQNCTLNGKLLTSGRFSRVLVDPAAHDSGAAVGAALAVTSPVRPPVAAAKHVYLGRHIGEPDEVRKRSAAWSPLVEVTEVGDPVDQAARLLADGNVIGWVQGRSEFGPRALGNRSILADPREQAMRDQVNLIVKGREGFRPFAPSVPEEHIREYFDYPVAGPTGFMVFTVDVLPPWRGSLGAVTHVDGSARVHPVSREANPLFHGLLTEFGKHTGVPILLNTSFNNSSEPIVDSVDDAITCLLTTRLDALIIGEVLLTRSEPGPNPLDVLSLEIPTYACFQHVSEGKREFYTARRQGSYDKPFEISAEAYGTLIATRRGSSGDLPGHLAQEFAALWSRRLVRLVPRS